SSSTASFAYVGPRSGRNPSPFHALVNRGFTTQGYPTAAAASWHSLSEAGSRVGGISTWHASASRSVSALSNARTSTESGAHPTTIPRASHSPRSALHSRLVVSVRGSTTCMPCACAQERSAANAASVSRGELKRAPQYRDQLARGQRPFPATATQ